MGGVALTVLLGIRITVFMLIKTEVNVQSLLSIHWLSTTPQVVKHPHMEGGCQKASKVMHMQVKQTRKTAVILSHLPTTSIAFQQIMRSGI